MLVSGGGHVSAVHFTERLTLFCCAALKAILRVAGSSACSFVLRGGVAVRVLPLHLIIPFSCTSSAAVACSSILPTVGPSDVNRRLMNAAGSDSTMAHTRSGFSRVP